MSDEAREGYVKAGAYWVPKEPLNFPADDVQRIAALGYAHDPQLLALIEQIARRRAADELRAAADEIVGDGRGGFDIALRRINSADMLRQRADAIEAGE